MLSPVTGGFYYGKIVAGIARELATVGGHVVLVQTLDAGLGSDEVVSAPDFSQPTAWDHLDGVISIASATQRNYLYRLQAAGKAIALASDEIEGFAVPSATPDNAVGITQAVDHLIGHGHTRIGFAANLIQPDMRERHEAYRVAMLAQGIEPHAKWFFDAFDNGELGGRDVAHQLVAAAMPITAMILATDRNAIGCMAQLTDLGIRVPEDLAIVGFDGLEAGARTVPTLSTVSQPFDEIGASAARLVLAQLRGDNTERGAVRSPSHFLPRGSCGCSDDEWINAADGGITFWRDEAKMRFARSVVREDSMREQYEISMQLLDHGHADPRHLQWLAATAVRGAYLALWDGEPSEGRLRIVGMHDPAAVLSRVIGTTCTVEQFPPASLIALANAANNEVTIVVPVKARGLDFGLLAVAGEVDALSNNGRETHNQWAALLTAALEQQSLIETVRTSEERYSLWEAATNDGLWDWDLTTDTIHYSRRCMELLGHLYTVAGTRPSVWFDAVHPEDLDRVREELRVAVTGHLAPVAFDHRVLGADGSYRSVSCRALPIGPPDGPAARIVGSIHDSEPRKQLEELLRQGALYDEVTGLPNRKLFLERLDFAITDARAPTRLRYAVVFLDLDGFKLVNDSLGHLAGDRLLTQIGQRLRNGLRPADVAARFGGDEFAVLLHNLESSSIQPIVARMQASLATPIDIDGHKVAVTASVGITTSDGGYTNAEDVLRDADIAMYHAKGHNRGSFAMFDVAMRSDAVARLSLQSEIRQAIDQQQFEVHYQPIVRLGAKATDRFEALVRWRHPDHGLVAALDFLPDVEEIGLIVTMGRWVINDVCRQIRQWQRSYEGAISVNINISHREFSDPTLLPHISDCLRRHRLVAANITLEITEEVIRRKPEAAFAVIEQLHAAGIGVHIGGVGTGTSSVQALRLFPIQALKIDRAFIHDLGTDQRTAKLVQIILDLGLALGFDVVAEGVETARQLQLLQEMGCRTVQGFLFAEAVDADTAGRLLGRSLAARNVDEQPDLRSAATSVAADVDGVSHSQS
ncbi:MAG: EAL domain-containing protein [Ilumatobacteraceae bacterium]|nr:EAL domain-containing protein [Ilumatobacteraceae bacterium]